MVHRVRDKELNPSGMAGSFISLLWVRVSKDRWKEWHSIRSWCYGSTRRRVTYASLAWVRLVYRLPSVIGPALSSFPNGRSGLASLLSDERNGDEPGKGLNKRGISQLT